MNTERQKRMPYKHIMVATQWMGEKYETVDGHDDEEPIVRSIEGKTEDQIFSEFLEQNPELSYVKMPAFQKLRRECYGKLYASGESCGKSKNDIAEFQEALTRHMEANHSSLRLLGERIGDLERRISHIAKLTGVHINGAR